MHEDRPKRRGTLRPRSSIQIWSAGGVLHRPGATLGRPSAHTPLEAGDRWPGRECLSWRGSPVALRRAHRRQKRLSSPVSTSTCIPIPSRRKSPKPCPRPAEYVLKHSVFWKAGNGSRRLGRPKSMVPAWQALAPHYDVVGVEVAALENRWTILEQVRVCFQERHDRKDAAQASAMGISPLLLFPRRGTTRPAPWHPNVGRCAGKTSGAQNVRGTKPRSGAPAFGPGVAEPLLRTALGDSNPRGAGLPARRPKGTERIVRDRDSRRHGRRRSQPRGAAAQPHIPAGHVPRRGGEQQRAQCCRRRCRTSPIGLGRGWPRPCPRSPSSAGWRTCGR